MRIELNSQESSKEKRESTFSVLIGGVGEVEQELEEDEEEEEDDDEDDDDELSRRRRFGGGRVPSYNGGRKWMEKKRGINIKSNTEKEKKKKKK